MSSKFVMNKRPQKTPPTCHKGPPPGEIPEGPLPPFLQVVIGIVQGEAPGDTIIKHFGLTAKYFTDFHVYAGATGDEDISVLWFLEDLADTATVRLQWQWHGGVYPWQQALWEGVPIGSLSAILTPVLSATIEETETTVSTQASA
jgi:hypothetical protein